MSLELEFRSYSLPLLRPLRTAHGVHTSREGGIVRLTDEAGRVGLGEVCPLPGFNRETWSDADAALRALGDRPACEDITRISPDLECLHAAIDAARRMMEIDSAAAEGRADEQPSPAAWPVACLLPAGRAALKEIDARTEIGFRVFKWKVGVDPIGEELALLDDLLARMPDGARLRLDANGAWDRRQSERWLDCCAERPIEHVEQPIAWNARGAEDLLLGLAGDYPTPVALDESLVRGSDIATWLGNGWPGVFVVKPSLLAEPTLMLERLALAKSKVVFSSALETAVGARNALTLAFSWRGERRALGFGVWPLFAEPCLNGPYLAPFIQWADVAHIDSCRAWNALN